MGAWYNINTSEFKPMIVKFPEEIESLSDEDKNNLGWYEVIPSSEIIPPGSIISQRTYELDPELNKVHEIIEVE